MPEQRERIIEKHLGHLGRILGSKTIYSYNNPNNFIIYNSNLINEHEEKIWHGDLDLTKEENNILELAKELNTNLYVFFESDYRLDNKSSLEKAVYSTHKGVREDIIEYYKRVDNTLIYKPDMIYNEKNVDKVINFDLMSLEKYCKKKSPLDLFYDKIITDLGGAQEGKVFYPTSVYITKSTNEILEYIYKKWVVKYHKEIHKARLENTVSMEFFNIGPSVFRERQHWMDDEKVYIIGETFLSKDKV